jgi:hypothetical protein
MVLLTEKRKLPLVGGVPAQGGHVREDAHVERTEMFSALGSGLAELQKDLKVAECMAALGAAASHRHFIYVVCGCVFASLEGGKPRLRSLVLSGHGFWVREATAGGYKSGIGVFDFRPPNDQDIRGMLAAGYTLGRIRERLIEETSLVVRAPLA